MNTRRKLVIALGAGALLPRWAAAQQGRVFRIGWLSNDRAEIHRFLMRSVAACAISATSRVVIW